MTAFTQNQRLRVDDFREFLLQRITFYHAFPARMFQKFRRVQSV